MDGLKLTEVYILQTVKMKNDISQWSPKSYLIYSCLFPITTDVSNDITYTTQSKVLLLLNMKLTGGTHSQICPMTFMEM